MCGVVSVVKQDADHKIRPRRVLVHLHAAAANEKGKNHMKKKVRLITVHLQLLTRKHKAIRGGNTEQHVEETEETNVAVIDTESDASGESTDQ